MGARPPSSTSTSSSTITLRLALRPAAAYTTSTSKPLDFGKHPSKSRPMSSSYQDVLSSHPPKKLHVRWPDLPDMMQEGQELRPDQTARMPTVCWDGDENDFHTLAMVDPDAPSRDDPKFGEWRHWLVTNIPGSQVNKGTVLAPYMGPGPPPGTGHHRYVFVVFKQKDQVPHEVMHNEGKGRANFKVEQWAHKHGMTEPLAASYFIAKHH